MQFSDKVFATLGIGLFLIFLSFLVININENALWVVILFVAGLSIYDFWIAFKLDNAKKNK